MSRTVNPFSHFGIWSLSKKLIPSLQINHSLVRQGDPDDLTRGRVTWLEGENYFYGISFSEVFPKGSMHFWKLLTFQVWKLRAWAKSIQNVRSEVIFQICYQHTDFVSNKVVIFKLSLQKMYHWAAYLHLCCIFQEKSAWLWIIYCWWWED